MTWGAQADWDDLKKLAKDEVIAVDGLVLVSRDLGGKIDVKDNAHSVRVGAFLGAAGGLLVGLIFPPAFLASGVVGAGIGAGVGGLRSHHEKNEIRDEVADDLPRGLEARGRPGERRRGEEHGNQHRLRPSREDAARDC